MMALKPIGGFFHKGLFTTIFDTISSRKADIDLRFPDGMEHLQLNRIYRCTQNITEFYEEIVKHTNRNSFTDYYGTGFNSSSISHSPGHEIYGNLPEVLLLPQCNCHEYCRNPTEHLFVAKKTKIIALLKRAQVNFNATKVTVIIDTERRKENCVDWLRKNLEEEGIAENFEVKTVEQCRGLEFPVLVTIGSSSVFGDSTTEIMDTWTRVTSALITIHMERKFNKFSDGLKAALHNKKKLVAKQAEEQEHIHYTFVKKLYMILQHRYILLLCIFFLGRLLAWLLEGVLGEILGGVLGMVLGVLLLQIFVRLLQLLLSAKT